MKVFVVSVFKVFIKEGFKFCREIYIQGEEDGTAFAVVNQL
jgi:hypothetical protein